MFWTTDIMKTARRFPNDGQQISESLSRLLDAQIVSCKIELTFKHIIYISYTGLEPCIVLI